MTEIEQRHLAEEVARLRDLLRRYVDNFPAFRRMNIGAPGSQKRLQQERDIALEDEALAALR